MNIAIPYLDRKIEIEIAEENILGVFEPNEFAPGGTPEELIARSLDHAIPGQREKSTSFEEFLSGARDVLIVINDQTRPTPTPAMLGEAIPRVLRAGISAQNIHFIVATGAHRAPTETEYHQILGEFYDTFRKKCVAHDARKEEDLVDLGATRNGTPIVLNKRIFEADRIIITGSVEPHYFAGYTGGRKAFLPGLASYRTIQANHAMALSPHAKALALDGNPVHEDMIDALRLIKAPVFSIMAVLDKDQRVAEAKAGDISASFYAAIETAQRIFCVAIPRKADIVVSVAKFPMDIDLYQSQKAIDNGALALKDGGTLILVSSCRSGLGDEAYANVLARASSPAEALEKIKAGYVLGYHKAAKMAEISARATIQAFTELPPERLRGMFIEPILSLQEAVDTALAKARRLNAKGEEPHVLVLLDGCVTIPKIL